ncbi:hypothetical protein PTKIN_Ptkin02bG0212500 [Pterospermum kingtungense]
MANIRFLSLNEFPIWPVCPSKAKLPVFHNLVRLDIECSCQNWHILLALLECADNLRILVFCSLPSRSEHGCDQALEESVPKCVSMSLKILTFKGVYNHECEVKLLRYVLGNAKFLERLEIGIFSCLKKQGRLMRDLLKYPRASMACDISFFFEPYQ